MTPSTPLFYAQKGLHVEIYDLMTAAGWCSLHSDVPFYIGEAMASPGPVLELACGTGRVSLPLAAAGLEVHGLDASPHMLEIAEQKRRKLDSDAAGRLHFHEGDMTAFDLGIEFGTVIIAFRSFQILHTTENQRRCLARIRNHLAPNGKLILNLFDPRYEFIAPGAAGPGEPREMVHPRTGNTVKVRTLARTNDPLSQTFSETREFTEHDARGKLLRKEEELISLKWTFRHEMRLLAELCGFQVTAEYSDFQKSAPAYSREQIWILASA